MALYSVTAREQADNGFIMTTWVRNRVPVGDPETRYTPAVRACPDLLYKLFLVGCLTSQQYPSVSQGRICLDNCTCCHTEIEVADQTLYLTQIRYTDTGPASPSADPIPPDAWHGSHWNVNLNPWYGLTWKKIHGKNEN